MPCAAPIEAWRPTAGGPLLFNVPNNGRAYYLTQIPCGYCILCRKEQARQTAVRIIHEASQWPTSCFLTLTYRPEHEPMHGSLHYPDLAKFWKRLRKAGHLLRYYAVGEYGDKSFRPHYHAILFGLDFTQDAIIVQNDPHRLWTSPTLENIWGLGTVKIGAVTFATARYTASYIVKKLRSKQRYVRVDESTGELIDLVRPRAFMSRNLGKEWWLRWNQQTQDHDHVIVEGRPQKPPKAYDKWLKELNEKRIEEIKEERKKEGKKNRQTKEQLHARARNAHAHAQQKSKQI